MRALIVDDECKTRAAAVDGRLLECCRQEPVSLEALRAAGVGSV